MKHLKHFFAFLVLLGISTSSLAFDTGEYLNLREVGIAKTISFKECTPKQKNEILLAYEQLKSDIKEYGEEDRPIDGFFGALESIAPHGFDDGNVLHCK